ncbi:hypothetical protein GCM10010336_61640 [Streptomyces goshikiensis]|nr:hypothetical protein GCM10010336_61640 [Streptomyces goshikiensis]
MPSPSPNSNSDGYDIAFKALLGALAVALPLSNLAWLGGNATAWATGADPWAPYQPAEALLHPERLWPAAGETSLLFGARIVPAALLLILTLCGYLWWSRRQGAGGKKKPIAGMAKQKDIEPLLAKAVTVKARSLRPSLRGSKLCGTA